MVNQYYQKTRTNFEKKHTKDIKIVLKKKKKRGEKRPRQISVSFLRRKRKSISIIMLEI